MARGEREGWVAEAGLVFFLTFLWCSPLLRLLINGYAKRSEVIRKLGKNISLFKILCNSHALCCIIRVLLVGLVGLAGSTWAQNLSPNRNIIFFDFHQTLVLKNPVFFSDHPLVNTVILPVSWPEVEPSKGTFNFAPLDARIDIWSKAGKRIMLRVAPYGQDNGNDSTPAWIYDTVPSINFTSKQTGAVKIPMVWNNEFLTEYSSLILTLARKYDLDPRVQYIEIGIGHLGYMTAQPSTAGQKAFLQAGWTLGIWEKYIDDLIGLYYSNFTHKQLVITITPLFLRHYLLKDNIVVGERIAEYAASKNYCIRFDGIDQDPKIFQNTGFPTIVKDLASLNLNIPSLGFGDDWPLYGSTGEGFRTAADFQAILNNVYNLWVSINKKYPIFLVLLAPDLAATQEGNNHFNANVYNALVDFISKVN